MKKVLIFAGTTEGRKLSECLSASGVAHTVCVATEYGEIILTPHPLAKVHCGKMNLEEIREFIGKGDFTAVVDATHPYAELVTKNIKEAMRDYDIPYLRLKRQTDIESSYDKIKYFKNKEKCVEALKNEEGNILLTTGSKELAIYCSFEEIRNRLYVRVLPALENMKLCKDNGIEGKQILALQGPFTADLNEAIIRQYQIKCLVTKKSGRNGGYLEKIKAAEKVGIPVYVIGHSQDEGYSFDKVCHILGDICGCKIKRSSKLEIILAGVGMGSKDNLTREVFNAIENADILLGAKRLIEGYWPRFEKKPFYRADQIIPYLKEIQEKDLFIDCRKVVILFSGDSGFYSGCPALYQLLQEEIMSGNLEASVRIIPGISSVAYFAATIGQSYHDAAIYSFHGKELLNLARRIKREKKTFLLMSGVKDVNRVGKQLIEAGLNHCEILAGYQLSYPEQKILTLTPEECCKLKKEGLYTCCIINHRAEYMELTHGKSDTEFIRDKVPMTREEVREVSICKLKLHNRAVVYDIGSGTGSIAIEIAGLSDNIQVYAVEKKEEAVFLIKKNKEKFKLDNIEVIPNKAPEVFLGLPIPTHAFIGGSSGSLNIILSDLYQMNPQMRVVINAVSMETICEIKEMLSLYPVENEEIVQIQVNRSRKTGAYHLMQGENPVWICSFNFRKVVSDEA